MRKNLTYCGIISCMLLFFAASGNTASAQSPCDQRGTYFYWVGDASNDFFDEMNWRVGRRKIQRPLNNGTGGPPCRPGQQPKFIVCRGDHNPATDKKPNPGSIDPNTPIPYNLVVDSASLNISSPLIFSCLEKGLTLHAAQLEINAAVKGTIHLEETSTLRMGGTTFPNEFRISLEDQASWVYFDQLNPHQIGQLPLASWMTNLEVPENANDLLINQYYQQGAVLRMNQTGFRPITIYDAPAFGGSAASVGKDTIYTGAGIPGNMARNIRSFKLKRGYMATLATNTNGTGKSQVFIASEKDLEVNAVTPALNGSVSYIRVVPWNWATKKGIGGNQPGNPLDAGWYYNWGNGAASEPNFEYVPMAWGAGATAPTGIQNVIAKPGVTHLLGFNESDNCEDQSGQFNNLCEPEVAVAYYERLMQTGLRLGTPAPRENGPSGWLRNFARIAKERDVRFDFVAVHWYDWASSPANSPFANPQQVFNRFKTYLQQVYNEYQLPIWITEFNATPNRDNSVQAAFLQLALPYLDTLSYVERYAYFQPNPNNASTNVASANYFDSAGNLTNIGQIYLDHSSAPSMPDSSYTCANNLNNLDLPQPETASQQYVFEAECGSFPGTKWTIGEDSSASNGKFLKGNTQLEGATSLASQVHLDFEVTEESNFRIWIRSRLNGAVALHINHERVDSVYGMNNPSFTWQSVPRLYRFKPGMNRVSLGFINNQTEFDQIALIAGSEDVEEPSQPAGYCENEPFVWGADSIQPIFAEAETAAFGTSWNIGSNEQAINGQFLESGTSTSPDSIPGSEGWITFNIETQAAGAYQFWSKIQGLETSADQLWLKVDDGAFRKWAGLNQPDFVWKWMRFDPGTEANTRQEYLFLDSGTHTFTIAYGSGGVKIDRAALMPVETSPATIDPDVFLQTGPLSYEAEEAQFIAGVTVQNCATASNGQQVNIGRQASGGLRFNDIPGSTNGSNELTIHYMSAVPRSLRIFVNGTDIGIQQFPASGPWCFNGGVTNTYTLSVELNAGPNAIEIRPLAGTDAPIIDRIVLERPTASLEAEEADITGTVAIQNCNTASNGAIVNMGFAVSNAVQFNNINIPVSGDYDLEVSYLSNNPRTLRMIVDGNAGTVYSFEPSGEWCFNGGSPAVKTIRLSLSQGTHSIRFQPNAGEAPLLDKIELKQVDTTVTEAATSTVSLVENTTTLKAELPVKLQGEVYPNPARSGSVVYLPGIRSAMVTLLDIRGAVLKRQFQPSGQGFVLPPVTPGIYLLRMDTDGHSKTYRLVVQ